MFNISSDKSSSGAKTSGGARKIYELLLGRLPSHVKVPARSTIHAIMDRNGLVAKTSRTRTRAQGTPLSAGLNPNDLWCTDYKGEFQLGNKRYCYPYNGHRLRLALFAVVRGHGCQPRAARFPGL